MDLAAFWHAIENPILFALPVFAVCIAIEAAFYAWDAANDRAAAGERGYLSVDTRTSLSMGAGALVAMVFFKTITLVLFVWLWQEVAPWHIPVTWWSWAALLLITDFTWYCNHRFSHVVRIGWAAHQAHHSSEYFNFGTALRQKWNPWSEAIFWLPLPLLGFEPWMIYVVFGGNLVYQFFSHTERIGRLWAPVEYVFNTPSHHRVHHGSDDIYLDRNYGGILIVWDRLFGTFQPEIFTPRYGLTSPVETYNLLELEYGEYRNIWRDVRAAAGLRARLGYVFGPPGWNPVDGRPVLPANDDPARRTSADGAPVPA
ncbi:sterol desaturase family protein [Nocardioides jejuensis]|uniref:Sterol desaturase family protein n=1 Tax=Nocardioides jejuensis TaxID=2502782 RepID=A0A4R1C0Z2_9ACTN|nr:sterol desaturase family protein [Nocardioides jejuensis]TCJ24124.1 sterol desaturase family protein [Nocardioides jejuensis]